MSPGEGATDIIQTRGNDAAQKIKAITGNLGVDCALECVGTAESWSSVLGAVRADRNIGAVGLPYQVPDIRVYNLFFSNIGVNGGPAPAAHYIPKLMPDVLSGKLNVSDIFTKTVPLSDIAEGYKAMDERSAIKALVKP